MSVIDDDPNHPYALPIALTYASLGLRVVPIRPEAKAPILGDWPNRASSDPDTIKGWWAKRPRAGVGLVMGRQPDGAVLVAIDVDNHNPAQLGADTLADLEEAYGRLPDTWRQVTGSGGAHIVLRVPDGTEIRNDAGKLLGPGIDVRGDGGQILVEPTIHPNGRPYAWEDDCAPWDIPVADAPAWLVGLLTARRDEPRERPSVPYDGPERPGDRWMTETSWRSLLETDGAEYLGTHATEGWEAWARPGIDGDHTSASLYYKGSASLHVFTSNWPHLEQGRSYDKLGYLAATRFGDSLSDAIAWLVSIGYGSAPEHDDGDGLIGDTLKSGDPPPGPTLPPPPSRLRAALIHGDEITNLPSVEWLIPGVLQRNSLAALYGPPKTYKSFLAVDLSLHLTNGVAWRNKLVERPTRVLYVVAEGAPGVGPRATAWVGHHGGDMAGMSWIPLAPNLFRNNLEAKELAAIAAEWQCELVVIDTLARSIAGAEENSAKDLGTIVEHLDLIRTESGAAVLVVHHMGKNGAQGMRGSSALHGAIDTGLEVKGNSAGIKLTLADQKNAESGQEWWWRPLSDGLSVVLEPLSGPPEAGNVMELNVLKQLHALGGSASNADWMHRCQAMLGVGRRLYEGYRKYLLTKELVELDSERHGSAGAHRYRLTRDGSFAIEEID